MRKLSLFSCATVLVMCSQAVVMAECSKDQAHQKMRALQQAYTEHSADSGEDNRKYTMMGADTAMVGHLLASKQYGEACRRYDEIARTYGVDLGATQKKLSPVIDSKATASGKCDVMTATRRVTESFQKVSDALKAQGLTEQQVGVRMSGFSNRINPAFALVQTDPNQACQLVSAVEKEYGVR